MEGTGMSLFQGAGSIHINNSVQERLDEQEELEDEKRRHEELKNKLDNGFDDLMDDDEASSVNSSANFTVDAVQNATCSGEQKRTSKPPTYVESLKHVFYESPSCETPKSHYYVRHQDDSQKYCYSPAGAGDGQNNCCQQEYKGHVNGINNYDNKQEHQNIMNYERLKLMYEMRVKECQQLATEKEELRSQLDMETDSLRARLAAAVTDRDKTELSLQEAHHLLASSKHKLVELEQQVNTFNDKLTMSEHEKEQLKLELRSASMSLQEAQQRLHTFQVAQTHNTDTLFREQQDRHREEVDRLQTDFQKAKHRLEEKENAIKMLERQCKEKDREREELLLAKGSTINGLARELEAAQSRLTETTRLKEKVSQVTTERNAAREQVKELGSKLEVTAYELVLCRNKLTNSQKEYEDWRTTLQQIVQEALPDNSYIGEPHSPGKLSTLKDILTRYRQQSQKNSVLQEELSKRDKKLDCCRKQESELRSKLEEYKGVEMQLNSRLAMLQNKLDLLGTNSDDHLLDTYKQQNAQLQDHLDQLRADHKTLELKYTELEMNHDKLKKEKGSRASLVQEANADLLRELEKYSTQLKETFKENGELKTLYLKVCSERDAKSREMKEIENKLNSLEKDKDSVAAKELEYKVMVEKERHQVEKLTADLANDRDELERANKRISELQKEFTNKQKEFTDKLNKYIEEERSAVRKDLEMCVQCHKHMKNIKNLEEQLNKCHLKLATQDNNEELMQELKSKAEFFKNYIVDKYQRLQELRSVGTNTDDQLRPTSGDENQQQHTERTHEETLAARTNLMLKEKEIREQIAEKFTLEIKTIEMNCTKRLKEMENGHMSNVNKLKSLLEKKADEVETLKQFVLSERSKITDILEAKENEISMLIKENNCLQEEYQDLRAKATDMTTGLEKAQGKVAKLKMECERRGLELHNEREKSERSRSDLMQKMQVLDAKTAQMEAQHELLKEKYKNVKKTAFTYKEYANKKDAHVENELDRIKSHYNDIVKELQAKIQQLVARRQQNEVTDRINQIQSNFNAVMSDLSKPL